MPEMRFSIRWPDGSTESCYSPSLVIKNFFVPGEIYPLEEFVATSRTALNIASDRVKAEYGFVCSSAMDQLARIELAAKSFAHLPNARVSVDAFEE